jgi:hypothetical protein
MSNKVVVFKIENNKYCVMNVPSDYQPNGPKPDPEHAGADPAYFDERSDALLNANDRHGWNALVIDETSD